MLLLTFPDERDRIQAQVGHFWVINWAVFPSWSEDAALGGSNFTNKLANNSSQKRQNQQLVYESEREDVAN